MQVTVSNERGEVIWMRGENEGMTSKAYSRDGTLPKIIATLESALEQAKAEMPNP